MENMGYHSYILFFLLLVISGGLLSQRVYRKFIENQIMGQAVRHLNEKEIQEVRLEGNYHSLTVEGRFTEPYDSAVLSTFLNDSISGATVTVVEIPIETQDQIQSIEPIAKDASLNVVFSQTGVTVAGLLPTRKLRDQIFDDLEGLVPGKAAENKITVAEHVTDPHWLGYASRVLPIVKNALTTDVAITFTQSEMTLHGSIYGIGNKESLIKQLRTGLPVNYAISETVAILPQENPSITFRVSANGEITIGGYVETIADLQELVSPLKQSYPAPIFASTLSVDPAVKTRNWSPVADFFIQFAKSASEGEAKMRDEILFLSGKVENSETELQLTEAAQPTWSRIETDLIVEERPKNPVVSIENLLSEIRIYFQPNQSNVTEEQMPKVVRLAEIIHTSPLTEIVVIGFADFTGDRAQNEKIAQKRAEAVCIELVDLGIDENQLGIAISLGGEETDADEMRKVEVTVKK